jgi:hypothetical protein
MIEWLMSGITIPLSAGEAVQQHLLQQATGRCSNTQPAASHLLLLCSNNAQTPSSQL